MKNVSSNSGSQAECRYELRSLLDEYARKWREFGWGDITEDLYRITKITVKHGHHPCHKIDNVVSRVKLIELLHSSNIYDSFIKAGFYVAETLRLYLSSTCFDILGQNVDYVTFDQWLTDPDLKSERCKVQTDIGTADSQDPFSLCKRIHEEWNRRYSMNQSIHRFFTKVLECADQDILLKRCWIADNPHSKTFNNDSSALLYSFPRPQKWLDMKREQQLGQLIRAIGKVCRNAITHEGRRYALHASKDHFPAWYRKFATALMIASKGGGQPIMKCSTQEELYSLTDNRGGFNMVIIGLCGNQPLVFSETPFDEKDFIRKFLEY